MSTPDLGIFLPNTGGPGDPHGDIPAAARRAEGLGFESVWSVDQLVYGTPMTIVESTVTLAAAAAVTTRVKLGFGVMILALRPTVWAAKQVQSLQHLSGDRVILGVGLGEARHPGNWGALGVPRSRRGQLTDAALAVLPDLIAGRPSIGADGVEFRIGPGATVPPIVVGGTAEPALARAARAGGWFGVPLDPGRTAQVRERLAELAAADGRPQPTMTALVMAAITGDPTLPDRTGVVDLVTDPTKKWAFPASHSDEIVRYGEPAYLAEQFADLGESGIQRVVVSVAAGEWDRQADLLAQTQQLLS